MKKLLGIVALGKCVQIALIDGMLAKL